MSLWKSSRFYPSFRFLNDNSVVISIIGVCGTVIINEIGKNIEQVRFLYCNYSLKGLFGLFLKVKC